jgi:hypothetical protein
MHFHRKWLITGLIVSGLLLLFSCMGEKDMRAEAVNDIGAPDEIQSGGIGVNEFQIYFYDRADLDRAYVYQKSASGCGSQGNWYVANVIYPADYYYGRTIYTPPAIVHTPVKTAPPGVGITISAKITDDAYVKNAVLSYRIKGETDYVPVTMAPADSVTYQANIPEEKVTVAGVEYHIEAQDSAHNSRLPDVKGDFLITVTSTSTLTYGKQQKFPKIAPMPDVVPTGKSSPVSP